MALYRHVIYVSYDKYFSLGPFYETCIDASLAIQKIKLKITVDAQIGTRSQNIFISVKSQEFFRIVCMRETLNCKLQN